MKSLSLLPSLSNGPAIQLSGRAKVLQTLSTQAPILDTIKAEERWGEGIPTRLSWFQPLVGNEVISVIIN